MVAGKIVQSTLDECREAYAIWTNMVLFDLFLFFLIFLSFIYLIIFSRYWIYGMYYLYQLNNVKCLFVQAHEFLMKKKLEKQEG